MSSAGGDSGSGVGVFVGAGVGGAVVIVVIVAVIIYCFLKSRKQNNKQMKKSTDIFATSASNTQLNYPKKGARVNMNPDPEAARKDRSRRQRSYGSENGGHVNPAYARHSSDSSSLDEGRDLSPPRVRRTRGGHDNEAYMSESSFDDSSSLDEDGKVVSSFDVEHEDGKLYRSSFKRATNKDSYDGGRSSGRRSRSRGGRGQDEADTQERRSRRDEFSGRRNPRSDSPLTIETLQKHEERHQGGEGKDDIPRKSDRKNREPSPSVESSNVTRTSEISEVTGTTVSSGRRYTRNESFRRASPSRSSSHRRYRKDNKDSSGRKRPARTPSGERKHRERERNRSRSPGSSRSSRSRTSSASEAKKINKEQAVLPIFNDPKMKKKSSVV